MSEKLTTKTRPATKAEAVVIYRGYIEEVNELTLPCGHWDGYTKDLYLKMRELAIITLPTYLDEFERLTAENAALVEALEIDPEELARLFHEVYEAQAPMFGYETKPETRCQWADMPEDNKRLMISVCTRIIGVLKVRTALEQR